MMRQLISASARCFSSLALLLLAACGRNPLPGDTANGERVFAQCVACHAVNRTDAPRLGPRLSGLIGRSAGSTDFAYSSAMKSSALVWTPENLDRYLQNPAALVPGNNMMFAGLPEAKDRQDVIAYIASQN